MGVKFTTTPCPRSKANRPCVLKHRSANPIGEGVIRHIWGCRRCGTNSFEDLHVSDTECALSSQGLHQWERVKTLSFQQSYRTQQIEELQRCKSCSAERHYHYQTDIAYNPHRK